MKPIQTVFNGHKFRSRLEARWAVFFHTLGLTYQYEPEGFVLDTAGRYLPDFFLPSGAWSCPCTIAHQALEDPPPPEWMEIKPSGLAVPPHAILQAQALARESKQVVALLIGDPFPDAYQMHRYYSPGHFFACLWHECVYCHAIYTSPHPLDEFCRHCIFHTDQTEHFGMGYPYGTRLNEAFLAARQARFEHGQRGTR